MTGANKGQGYALCQRILEEHTDTRVFLCSRDLQRGEEARSSLVEECGDEGRVQLVQLDVTDSASVEACADLVRKRLEGRKLTGIVSNAGILWGYPLPELIDVCATGVKRVLDSFVPLIEDDGRVVVVTSGLGPLIHSYASEERKTALLDDASTWDERIAPMIDECIGAFGSSDTLGGRISAFESIGFPGGPFAESAPDFHMYGIAKAFGDAEMIRVARRNPQLRVTSVDPGLVYSDLILRMPKYAGLRQDETSAASPKEGVEAAMRLLFDDVGDGETSGNLYAINKQGELVHSSIDKMPQKQE